MHSYPSTTSSYAHFKAEMMHEEDVSSQARGVSAHTTDEPSTNQNRQPDPADKALNPSPPPPPPPNPHATGVVSHSSVKTAARAA